MACKMENGNTISKFLFLKGINDLVDRSIRKKLLTHKDLYLLPPLKPFSNDRVLEVNSLNNLSLMIGRLQKLEELQEGSYFYIVKHKTKLSKFHEKKSCL